MCAIYGCIGATDFEQTKQCIANIAHRGPDSIHIKQLDEIDLAHARLSILDTSDDADQPMSDPSGRYWIVYNGEIYNYLEIRNRLKSKGYIFRTKCDTEVVLYAFIEWGDQFQDECNGMWAIAIWDNVKRELFLSRDRFGVKPLYYIDKKDLFSFASEMKAFFPIIDERRINNAIFNKISQEKAWHIYEGGEECILSGIYKLKAGHCAVYKEGKLKIRRWWSTVDHLIDVPHEYDKQVEMLRELFLDACRIRMRSDVPIGTALSGGVDSSAVVGAMHYIGRKEYEDVTGDWQNAFVACMPGSDIDETDYAKAAAEYIGIDLHEVIIHGQVTPDELLRELYLCEDPYYTSPLPFFQIYGAMHDNGVKVSLDGHGADELFAGYPGEFLYAVEDCKDIEEIEDILKTYNEMNIYEELKFSIRDFIEKSKTLKMSFDLDSVKGLLPEKFQQRLYYITHETSLPTLLRNYDRYSMANGVEIRMPFMDYRIVTFAFSISWRSKIRDGYSKKIVRDMASPFMAKDIMFRKQKIGFNTPITELARGDLKTFIMDTIHSKEFYECELINPLEVVVNAERLMDQETPNYCDGERLWISLMPFLWKKAILG